MSFIDSILISQKEFEEQDYIDWYFDGEVQIDLSVSPRIETRECNQYLQNSKDYESAKRWPHILMHDLYVRIVDTRYKSSIPDYEGVAQKVYCFKISEKYCYDGATIPRFAWRLIGAPSDPRFIVGALLHDVLCQHHEYVNSDRKLATKVLEKCCRCTGTGPITRFLMYWSVEFYQMFMGKW